MAKHDGNNKTAQNKDAVVYAGPIAGTAPDVWQPPPLSAGADKHNPWRAPGAAPVMDA